MSQSNHLRSSFQAKAPAADWRSVSFRLCWSFGERPWLNQFGFMASRSMSNNGSQQLPKATRSANGNNRQSIHNGISSREGSHSTQGGQVPAFNSSVVPPAQPFKGNAAQQAQQQPQSQPPQEVGRATPQPSQLSDEMSDEDIAQLIKDHKELRKAATLWAPAPVC